MTHPAENDAPEQTCFYPCPCGHDEPHCSCACPIPPAECDNYEPPLTCLTAPSSETARCDKCRTRPIPPAYRRRR